MFAKLSTLAAVLPLVSAFTLMTPTGVMTGGTVTFQWTATTQDAPYFSLELVNDVFHNTYAIANNVQTSLGTVTLQIPQIPPGDGYTVEAVAVNNINLVYAQSGGFAVSPATTPTTSMASTTSASSMSSASMPSDTTTSAPVTMISPVATPSTSAISSSASASPTSFNSGAASFKVASGAAPAAAMVLAAAAGAVMVF